MFDGADRTELDWKAVAQIAIQQRDRAENKANNLELDLALAQRREAALHARIAELVPAPPPVDGLADAETPAAALKGSRKTA